MLRPNDQIERIAENEDLKDVADWIGWLEGLPWSRVSGGGYLLHTDGYDVPAKLVGRQFFVDTEKRYGTIPTDLFTHAVSYEGLTKRFHGDFALVEEGKVAGIDHAVIRVIDDGPRKPVSFRVQLEARTNKKVVLPFSEAEAGRGRLVGLSTLIAPLRENAMLVPGGRSFEGRIIWEDENEDPVTVQVELRGPVFLLV